MPDVRDLAASGVRTRLQFTPTGHPIAIPPSVPCIRGPLVRNHELAYISCVSPVARPAQQSGPLIGARIKALREERKLSQEDLARLLGFKDRQTVSAIETGTRSVKAEELVLAVDVLGASLEYFTDPFRLVGEGRFCWRHTGIETEQLSTYERHAGRWIAAFRTLAPAVGRNTPLMRPALGLTRGSRFEDAMQAGERFSAEFGLGDIPSAALSEVVEREFGVLVLMVDAQSGISGAACRLPELDAILIARHEVPGRRHFDLAHELFHILTWEAMPPAHFEEVRDQGGNRVEQLANNFSSAVLMPAATLDRFGGWSNLSEDELIRRLNRAADELQVTASALKWRLVATGELPRKTAQAVPNAALRNNGRAVPRNSPPPLFSKPFMEVMALAVDGGQVSVRRMANLLDVSIDDLVKVFTSHGIEQAVEL